MISIRQSIDEDERLAHSFAALVNVFQRLAQAIPRAALPASPELSKQCRGQLRHVAERLKEAPSRLDIDQAGVATLTQIDEICRSNQLAIEERDAALKDVVASVAVAVNGFKGQGERHKSSLGKVADEFESLARINDVSELRRQLHETVAQLRHSVEEMRRESDASARSLETQVRAFEQRVEAARTTSSRDRLTGVGSRREAERHMQKIPEAKRPMCVLLFDIEGFRDINSRYGTPFGDKLLRALSHNIKERFPDEDTLFRWGADEFLVIAQGPLDQWIHQCRTICGSFASNLYSTFEGATRKSVSAQLAAGAAQYVAGETVEDLYRRARESLERNRPGYAR